MQRWSNLGGVLRKKARIYVWLLVGLVPIWAYGLVDRFAAPERLLDGLCLAVAGIALVASFWIVIWRWEAIEQRRISTRTRVLLLVLSCFIMLFLALFTLETAVTLGGLRTPWSE
jgi:hypothetical protein